MPTVIGKLSQEEFARLHPDLAVAAGHTTTADDIRADGMPDLPAPQQRSYKKAADELNAAIKAYTASKAKTGVMVLIENYSRTKMVYAVDFNTWAEPDGPTLREAQAFRATRDACRQHLRTYSDTYGSNLAHFMSDEECEMFVTKLIVAEALKMRVLDVPAEAFA